MSDLPVARPWSLEELDTKHDHLSGARRGGYDRTEVDQLVALYRDALLTAQEDAAEARAGAAAAVDRLHEYEGQFGPEGSPTLATERARSILDEAQRSGEAYLADVRAYARSIVEDARAAASDSLGSTGDHPIIVGTAEPETTGDTVADAIALAEWITAARGYLNGRRTEAMARLTEVERSTAAARQLLTAEAPADDRRPAARLQVETTAGRPPHG